MLAQDILYGQVKVRGVVGWPRLSNTPESKRQTSLQICLEGKDCHCMHLAYAGKRSITVIMTCQDRNACKRRPSSIPGWSASRIGATVSGKRQTTDTCCGCDQSAGSSEGGDWHSTLYSTAEMEPPTFRCSCSCSATADCAKHLALAEAWSVGLEVRSV